MEIPKPSESDRARFRSLVPEDPRVDVKPMFGNLGAFVNGNMFMGLFGSAIGLKLPDAQARHVLDSGGGSFGPAERPMAGYVSLPPAMTDAEATPLIAESLFYVGALPPKAPRQRKK
jgi:TfoX/Sxy family transcriptional regulator of competence genes